MFRSGAFGNRFLIRYTHGVHRSFHIGFNRAGLYFVGWGLTNVAGAPCSPCYQMVHGLNHRRNVTGFHHGFAHLYPRRYGVEHPLRQSQAIVTVAGVSVITIL